MICSKSKLDEELKTIAKTLDNNGYPSDVIQSRVRKFLIFLNLKQVWLLSALFICVCLGWGQ